MVTRHSCCNTKSWLLLLMLSFAGCGTSSSTNPAGDSFGEKSSSSTQKEATQTEHNYMGWWCVEHGVPEKECSICNPQAAQRFRARGDWCNEHNRAMSQCFQCNPEREKYYIQLFEAKFGHLPPKVSDHEASGD